MQQEKYDIFISYRRKDENGKEWGTSIARNILQGLEDRGYKGRVFFDHNKIGPEDFEKKILGAIKQAKVFLCILTKNAMDNCVNEGDWVRREICQAIESGLKIIFINPDNEFNHKLLPKGLPKELEIVKMQNSLEIRSGQKFEVDMDDVVKRYISEIVPCHNMPSFKSQPSVPMGILRVNTDLDCRVFNYGKDVGVAKAGVYTTFELPLGDNDLKYVGLESDDDCYGEMVTILENHQKLVRVKLLDKYNTRKAKEEAERKAKEEADKRAKAKAERDAYLLSLPDDDFEKLKENGKYGFIDKTGKEITPLKYDGAWDFSDGLARVELNGKCGYIDKTGKEITPLKYDDAWNFSDGLARVELNGKYGFIDKTGKEVIPLKYDHVDHVGLTIRDIVARRLIKDWEYKTGKKFIIPAYDTYSFSDGLAKVRVGSYSDGKYGFIDKTGKEVIPLKYDYADVFSDGLAEVKLNGKHGFIDTTGKEVIPLKYDKTWSFSEGLAEVELNGKHGFIDTTGKEVIPLKYDGAWDFSDGLAKVELDGKWGFIDKTGNEIIPLKYDYVGSFSDGLAEVRVGSYRYGKYGFIDKTGKEITPLKYDYIYDFRDGLAKVELDGKYGFIDKTGKEITPLKYDCIYDFRDGLAKVELDGKYGFVNNTGKEVALVKYDYIYDFRDGLARVELNGKCGFIDKTGKEIIPLKYSWVEDFFGGEAKVMTKNIFGKEIWFYIDKNGNRID